MMKSSSRSSSSENPPPPIATMVRPATGTLGVELDDQPLFDVDRERALTDPVDGSELLLLHEPHLVLGEALAPSAVQPRRIGTLVGWAIGAAAHRRAHAPAHAMARTELLHRRHRVHKVSSA